MAVKTETKLESKIFDKSERQRVLGRVPMEQARHSRRKAQQRMVKGPHTGKNYPRKRGAGFGRSHRASAPGQRPAPDTMTLVNAVTVQRTSETSAEVYIAEKRNPANGVLASEYAEYLQNNMDRPILSRDDAADDEKEMKDRSERAVKELL